MRIALRTTFLLERPRVFSIPAHLREVEPAHIEEMDNRSANVLGRAGVDRLGDLDGVRLDDLLDWERCGPVTQRRIAAAIDAFIARVPDDWSPGDPLDGGDPPAELDTLRIPRHLHSVGTYDLAKVSIRARNIMGREGYTRPSATWTGSPCRRSSTGRTADRSVSERS